MFKKNKNTCGLTISRIRLNLNLTAVNFFIVLMVNLLNFASKRFLPFDVSLLAFQELSPASKVVPLPSSTDIKIYFTEQKTPPKTSCQTQSISMALSPPLFSCCLSFLPTEIRRVKALCSRLRWSPSALHALLSSLQSNERKEPFQIIQGTSLNKGKAWSSELFLCEPTCVFA